MGILDGMIRVFGRPEPPPPAVERPVVAAVVVAAGSSTRMGAPKQLIPLRGVPAIARTLMAFESAQLIDEIVIVARSEDMLPIYDICKAFEISRVTKILCGGASRQQSVFRGIVSVHETTQFFAIHDGARPLVSPPVIDRVVDAAFHAGAATAAVRVKDTVKVADERGFIRATPDRRLLWNVQTPQVFARRLYVEAMQQARAEGREYTDDCQLIERTGHPVLLCEGDYANIKLTTPEDVAYAESLLRGGLDADDR